MKTLYKILIFFITANINSQTIFPLEQVGHQSDKQGKYYKDVNGILDAYTGVWRWIDGNRELTFYLYKQEQATLRSLSGLYLCDVIVGYYIYKENGIELINTRQELIDTYDLYDGKMMLDRGGIGMNPWTTGYIADNAPLFYFRDHSVLTCLNGNYIPKQGDPGYWLFENSTTASVGLYTTGLQVYTCGNGEIVVHPNFPSNESITINKIENVAPPLD
ncbi:MAG: hypothetical protein NXH73_01515 [Flavobacteriaceae bacterium]|nr:hypothetical protein [Flavobacteriaceae bacterium]